MKSIKCSILVLFIVLFASTCHSGETMKGVVVEVHDGDTLKVAIDCNDCPPMFKQWLIRVLGIDTPELGSKCKGLKEKALKAKDMTGILCPIGSPVLLMEVDDDKYGGRLDAEVQCVNGNVADILKQMGLAREYWGKGPKPWSDADCTED